MGVSEAHSAAFRIAKYFGFAALAYVAIFGAYSLFMFGQTKSQLLTYGLNDSTATLLATGVMLLAIALPILAAFRILLLRGKAVDYAAILVLPLITWGIQQLPANFSAVTGEALRYCAERPGGELYCLDHPGVDPVTQKKLVAISPEIASVEYRRNRQMIPRRILTPLNEIRYFDELSGRPLVWVSPTSDGCFEAFDNDGIHPELGTPLVPASPTLVGNMRVCLANRDAASKRAAEAAVAERRRLAREQQDRIVRERQAREQTAKAAWQRFESQMAMAPSGWTPQPYWTEQVRDKPVRISYVESRRLDALAIARRLYLLGANVSHEQIVGKAQESKSRLDYAFQLYDAADAIRSASFTAVRLDLQSHDTGTGSIQISLE